MKLQSQKYGKQKVRFLRVIRDGDRHEVFELTAGINLEGDFESAYLSSDNSQVVATDTMKNTLHILASQCAGTTMEEYGIFVVEYFLKTYGHVSQISLCLDQVPWVPMTHSSVGYVFERSAGTPTARIVASRDDVKIFGGFRDWQIMKTTGSGFAGFPRNEFTTLPETNDRILATSVSAEWTYLPNTKSFAQERDAIPLAMAKVFAETFSPSVQRTLFQMGEAALTSSPSISAIRLQMPNKHYLPLDLDKFGPLTPGVTCWLPTDEPHGQIEAEISRENLPK